jgi:hypothetical protein
MRSALLLALLVPALAGIAHVQDTMVAPVEYVAGDVPWKCRVHCDGTLVLGEGSLALKERKQKNAKVIFSVPIATVVKVTNRIDTNAHDTSAVFAFGALGLAARQTEEYVSITSETDTKSETFVFKVAQNASDGIVAKIEFAAKRAKEAKSSQPASELPGNKCSRSVTHWLVETDAWNEGTDARRRDRGLSCVAASAQTVRQGDTLPILPNVFQSPMIMETSSRPPIARSGARRAGSVGRILPSGSQTTPMRSSFGYSVASLTRNTDSR